MSEVAHLKRKPISALETAFRRWGEVELYTTSPDDVELVEDLHVRALASVTENIKQSNEGLRPIDRKCNAVATALACYGMGELIGVMSERNPNLFDTRPLLTSAGLGILGTFVAVKLWRESEN